MSKFIKVDLEEWPPATVADVLTLEERLEIVEVLERYHPDLANKWRARWNIPTPEWREKIAALKKAWGAE